MADCESSQGAHYTHLASRGFPHGAVVEVWRLRTRGGLVFTSTLAQSPEALRVMPRLMRGNSN